jgi:hypothetical protein
MTKEEIHKTKDVLRDDAESTIFVCSVAPADIDDPLYDIFPCNSSLDCDTHVEADFFASRIMNECIEFCCHCAGKFESPVELISNLKARKVPTR